MITIMLPSSTYDRSPVHFAPPFDIERNQPEAHRRSAELAQRPIAGRSSEKKLSVL